MQLDVFWMFMIVFAFVIALLSALVIAYLLYEVGKLNLAMANMEKQLLKVETILEERKI